MIYGYGRAKRTIGNALLAAPIIKVGRWQSQDVGQIDSMDTPELLNVSFETPIPSSTEDLQDMITPNLPWAENQFQERVCGTALNPGNTFKEWPWYKGEAHRREELFSHTYIERFWPKQAGLEYYPPINPRFTDQNNIPVNSGIRYPYGDLNDVVNLLGREPYTRQAYLPIWNHEDTGVVHGERVPCSLGYHFLFRENKLNITYHIRSCDFVRHFADDVYMAARLCQWMCVKVLEKVDREVETIVPGTLVMHIGSLHCFRGDLPRLEREYGSK